jgi:putative DNA primase/helicase
MIDLRRYANLLGGNVSGRNSVLAPGPGHSRTDRSLHVTFESSTRFVVNSFAGDDWQACRDHVRSLLGISRVPYLAPKARKIEKRIPESNGKLALKIWNDSADPRGTVIEKYLRRRGLDLPEEAAGEAIRFHGNCLFGGTHTRAMICLVRNIITNTPQAIHRTALDRAGDKIKINGIDRRTLGPIIGGAIKLSPDEDVTTGLVIGEGIETVLAAATRVEHHGTLLRPAWACGSSGNLRTFPVLAGIESLTILVDHDASGGGQSAAAECVARWCQAGREVTRLVPRVLGVDFNMITQGSPL